MSYDFSDEKLHQLIGERIREERLRRDLSVEIVASRCGISRNTLGNIEAGKPTSTTSLFAVLRELRLLDALFVLTEPAPASPMAALKAPVKAKARLRASGAKFNAKAAVVRAKKAMIKHATATAKRDNEKW